MSEMHGVAQRRNKAGLLIIILNLQVSECAPEAVAHGYLTDFSRSLWCLPFY